MTPFSPGLAQGCFELLEMAIRHKLPLALIPHEFSKIGVMPAVQVIELAQVLNWVRAGDDGSLLITVGGSRLLSTTGYESRLRQALLDYIDIIRPPWIQNATYGRSRVLAFAGSEIAQVFAEAGLAFGIETSVVEFWDELAALARGQKGIRLNRIGRTGERLTIEYERERTGRQPKWVSIDSNADGYDVLSIAGPVDSRLLSIEVKATTVGIVGAFHLSSNEWERATFNDAHVFHLWDIRDDTPGLAVVSKEDMCPHVPKNQGQGEWEAVEIPFGAFQRLFSPQPGKISFSMKK